MVGTYRTTEGQEKSWYYDDKKGFIYYTQSKKNIIAQDVNQWARVVGTYVDKDGRSHGWTKHSGHFEELRVPNQEHVGSCKLNDLNVVMRHYSTTDGQFGIALWRALRKPVLIAMYPLDYSLAPGMTAINNRGDLAGWVDGDESHAEYRGMKWDAPAGTLPFIDAPDGGVTLVHDMNDHGLMAVTSHDAPEAGGSKSYAYDGTTWTELVVPGAYETHVYAVNHRGQLAGTCYCADGVKLFIANPVTGTPVAQR
jgi:hypothetical protein